MHRFVVDKRTGLTGKLVDVSGYVEGGQISGGLEDWLTGRQDRRCGEPERRVH